MNIENTLKLIADNDIELSDEQMTKINGIKEYIKDSENYIKTASNADKNWMASTTIVQTTDEVKKNIQQAENEMVHIAFEGYTTWYKHHNSDIANVAMYKLADRLEKADFHVWNSTYGNDQFASITVDFDCFQKKIQIFIPNSTKFDGDNEEDNQYWVQPKNADDECIMEGQYFDIHDLSGIEKYCTALYKFFDAQQDLEILQA